MLKTESGSLVDLEETLDQSSVHGWGVEACCPAFPVPEPVPVRGLEYISPESIKFLSSEQCCAH